MWWRNSDRMHQQWPLSKWQPFPDRSNGFYRHLDVHECPIYPSVVSTLVPVDGIRSWNAYPNCVCSKIHAPIAVVPIDLHQIPADCISWSKFCMHLKWQIDHYPTHLTIPIDESIHAMIFRMWFGKYSSTLDQQLNGKKKCKEFFVLKSNGCIRICLPMIMHSERTP